MEYLGELFADKPEQWGLRGDPYLWDDMAQDLAHSEFPGDSSEVEKLIKESFGRLTGRRIDRQATEFDPSSIRFYIEKYSHGGMSSGMVSLIWWRKYGLPLLLERYQSLRSTE
ncbi:hypothetical protein [Corynebacterium casei]|uniref:hypothetical protein n=1 Tax=Corynebacterium casei TaxID=160386 RepID=UPI003FD04DCB